MPFYQYKVIQNGKYVETTVEAASEAEAAGMLIRKNMTVVKLMNTGSSQNEKARSLSVFFDRGRFNVYTFTDQLAPLLKANIPLEQALAVVEEGMSGQSGAAVVQELRKGLQEGKKFSELIRARPTFFPSLYSSLIETGEQTGCLSEVMQELKRFLAASREFKDFVITASIYPAVILFVTFSMIVLLLTFFIPKFSKLFQDAGKTLPFLTQAMLDAGNFMKSVWWLWPLLVLAVIAFCRKTATNAALKKWRDRLLLKLPFIGRIIRGVQVSRFIRTLAIMVRNDVPILRSVQISSGILQNAVIADSFSSVASELKSGHKLSQTLAKSPYILSGAIAMLRISEESGDVAEMLTTIAESSESEVKKDLRRLLAALEPAIIICLALFIALIVLAVFQAIMKMNQI